MADVKPVVGAVDSTIDWATIVPPRLAAPVCHVVSTLSPKGPLMDPGHAKVGTLIDMVGFVAVSVRPPLRMSTPAPAIGAFVPSPSRLFVSSQNRFALSSPKVVALARKAMLPVVHDDLFVPPRAVARMPAHPGVTVFAAHVSVIFVSLAPAVMTGPACP